MSSSVGLWPATRLANAIRRKELGSLELLEHFLSRIERYNPAINAVVTLDVDRAREAARAADDAIAHGETVGPLHGLPITIKDAIETARIRSTGGAVELRDHVPTTDAPAVGRLKAAGAIVFGKTNLPPWSGDDETHNELFGTTNNPWALDHSPAGSSGGPAAAVAAGLTSFELGTDIGGSIRGPAHCCGVFGLKPSYGVVPQRGYLDHVGGGLTDPDINVFGPFARSAEDLDLLVRILAGPEPERVPAWRVELPAPRRTELADYRIGVWLDHPACPLDAEVHATLTSAVDQLVAAGAKIDDAHPHIDFAAQVELFFHLVGAATSWTMPDELLALGGDSHRAWLRYDEERMRVRARWAEWFSTYDILICPVSACAALPHDQSGSLFEKTVTINGVVRSHLEALLSWTGLIGVVGLPVAVPPVGRTPGGLPIGVQVVAAYLRDREAVDLARLVSEVLGGFAAPPEFP